MIAVVISEGIIIAMVTASSAIMIAVLSTVRSNKSEVGDARITQVKKEAADAALHLILDGKIDKIIEGSHHHAAQATLIEGKLDDHISVTERSRERNEEAHIEFGEKLGRIEGWIQGQTGS